MKLNKPTILVFTLTFSALLLQSMSGFSQEPASQSSVNSENTGSPTTRLAAPNSKEARDPLLIDSAWNRTSGTLYNHVWVLSLEGHLRAQLSFIQNDKGNSRIGLGDGFFLSSARLGLSGKFMDIFGFKIDFDGTVSTNPTPNDHATKVYAGLKDAYLSVEPWPFLGLKLGQFSPPFDIEGMESTSDRMFADSSIGSRGVKGSEGNNVTGVSRSREVGASLGAEHYYPMAENNEVKGLGLTYLLGVTNGSPATKSRNTSDQLAYYGRLELDWEKYIALGGAFYYNPTNVGNPPNELKVNELGFTADLSANFFGVTLKGSWVNIVVDNPQVNQSKKYTRSALHGQIAYNTGFYGLTPTFRYAYYDPSSVIDTDNLTSLTMGLNLQPDHFPFKAIINYSIQLEDESRKIDNNRFDLVVQAEW